MKEILEDLVIVAMFALIYFSDKPFTADVILLLMLLIIIVHYNLGDIRRKL